MRSIKNAGRPDEANNSGQWLDSMARTSAPSARSKSSGHAAQSVANANFKSGVQHEPPHMLIVWYANGVEFGFRREFQNAFVEAA